MKRTLLALAAVLALAGCTTPHCITCPDIVLPPTAEVPECTENLRGCFLLTEEGPQLCIEGPDGEYEWTAAPGGG